MGIISDSRNILNAGTDAQSALFGREDKTDATTNPTRFDDISANFEPGSIWTNLSTDHVYICVDNTADNAIWKLITLQISDQTANLTSTWSSHKINNEKANTNHDHNADVIMMDTDSFSGKLLRSTEDNVQACLERIDEFNPTRINDVGASLKDTYSSSKIQTLVDSIPVPVINDYASSTSTLYSSNKVRQLVDAIPITTIDDGNASLESTYSSSKIQEIITDVGASVDVSSKADLTYVNAQLDLKPDTSTVRDNMTAVLDQLSEKADLTYVDDQLNAKADQTTTYTKTEANNLLNLKANVTHVNLKANTTYVNEQLNLKADATYVNEQLNLKADATYVNEQLNLKADKTTTYTKTEANNLLNLKSNTTYVNDQLNLKADKTTTYTKAETDAVFARKSDTYTKAETDDLTNGWMDVLKEFPPTAMYPNYFDYHALTRTLNGITVSISSSGKSKFSGASLSVPTDAFDKVISNQIGWVSENAFFGSSFADVTGSTDPSSFYGTKRALMYSGDTVEVNNFGNAQLYNLFRTQVDGANIGRQWISIDCGEAKQFLGFRLYFNSVSGSNFKEYYVVGSNDDVNFTSLYHESDEDYSNGRIITKKLDSAPYRYYRVVVVDVVDPNTYFYATLQEWVMLENESFEDSITTYANAIEANTTAIATKLEKLDADRVFEQLRNEIVLIKQVLGLP